MFKHVFDDLLPSDAVINEDDVMQDFYATLQTKVSIDQDYVSLNALELFTRKNGFNRSI